jgi:hypothetical protein
MSESDPLDVYLPTSVRLWLEGRYYVRIGAQAKLERVIDDPAFWQSPERHVAYAAFSVRAWMLLGSTGVIRGSERNARVVATRALSLLVIPKDVYLQHWHHPYSAEELRQRLAAPEEEEALETALEATVLDEVD